ncbi:hypothetical protein ACNFU2_05520 [Chryseobacterium sp. PTM-20240506]|uniref:hypothetical protein n=1 Tax=unclassified Chryseobacterium TaxID=2593645 RepID=UPI002359638F|nr:MULTISPECIES: hypothetical protein [unclassified Chryseobacterium]MDC8104313.1 hypothetical protein [Chryseobacterium sp. B21-037]MDQ1803922.1 hypothetical protein [Chryseobacterium sp. CKR4-1]
MKTKTLLVLAGLATTQCMFNSCGEDNTNLQNENYQSTQSLPKTALSFTNGTYFTDPQAVNAGFEFIRSKFAQNPGYVLNQQDLNTFYEKAQIATDERLPLDQVNNIINKTVSLMQVPFAQAVQQLNISSAAKSLAITINNGSIIHLEANAAYNNLPANEKSMIKNINDYKYNAEQGNYLITGIPTGKQPLWITGGMIGMVGGGIIGFAVAGPVGALVGAGIGVVGGIITGAILGAK